MPEKPSDGIKTGRIQRKQKNGDIYVYERKTRYNPEKKYNEVLESQLVKIIRGWQHTGMMDVIDYLGMTSGIDEDLYEAADTAKIGEDTARKFISMARYLLASGGQELFGIKKWNHRKELPYRNVLFKKEIHRILIDTSRPYFFKAFFQRRGQRLKVSDVTAYVWSSALSGQTRERGMHNGFNGWEYWSRPMYSVYYSEGTGQPVKFAPVVSQIHQEYLTRTSYIKGCNVNIKATIISDGYCMEEYMEKYILERWPVIAMANMDSGWVRKAVDANKGKLMLRKNVSPYEPDIRGVSVVLMHPFKNGPRRIYLHLYYSPAKYEEDRIKGICEKYRGFFVLMSSKKQNTFECLHKYNVDTDIDCFFRAGEQDGSLGKGPFKWDPDRYSEYDSLMFVRFLALCYHAHIQEAIRKIRPELGKANGDPLHDREKNLSLEARLEEWLDRTPVSCQLQWFDMDRDNSVTAALQKLYLEKIGMDAGWAGCQI